ncbi:MAG: metallophosphoesterase family protein, partial [Bacteroidota bacterium]
MLKIGLLSDTHGYLDSQIFTYFTDCDEIWHAGDIGSLKILEALES